MTRAPGHGERPLRGDPRAAEIAKRYRELAPMAPDHGFDLFEIFDITSRIEMEIGFGRGLFMIQRTASAPDVCLLGLEIKKKLAYRVAERCQRLGLSRIRVMAGDVRAVLPKVTPDAAIERVFLNFPDPWWKKRHAKRRIIAPELLDQLARLLRPGGELFIQTDVEERAHECLDQLRVQPAFELSGSGLIDHNPFGAVSNREQRAVQDGLPVYRILATRRR